MWDSPRQTNERSDAMSEIHIGFLDFTLFEDKPEFYATYKMINTKNSNIYSDKFAISVVDLSKIELATEEDKAYGIDQWAKLFKAATWEELKTMATQNTVFEDVAKSVFMYSCDKDVLEQCRKVEYDQKYVKHLNDENKSLRASNADKDIQLADKDNQLADKDSQIAQKDARIAYLEAQLKQNE
jgi:hypothetical protein